MKKLILFMVAAATVVGCGGSGGGGGSSASPAHVATFITDSMDGNDHVWVTVHTINLQTATGSTNVFTSAAGVQVDLKTLRDSTGARFRFMSDDDVPAGTYTGATVTLDKALVVFPLGASAGTNMTFDPSLDTVDGKTAISLTFPTAVTVNSGEDDDIVIDFDLANWNESGGVVTPVLKVGSEDGLHDSHRHEDGQYEGTVQNLSGAAPDQTFTLRGEESSDVTVVLDVNTNIFAENGATLANTAKVEVEGAFDTTTNTLKATSLRISNPEDNHGETEDVDGSVTSFDGTAGSIVVAVEEVDGFLPGTTSITIDVSGDTTEFFAADGESVTKDAFFTALSAGMHVKAIGVANPGAGTFVASRVSLKHED